MATGTHSKLAGAFASVLACSLGKVEDVQDCFWWTQGQTMAGDPLRQVRSATKLCSKLREGRKRLHQRLQWRPWRDSETDELEEGEKSWGLREPCLLVRAKVDL